MGSVPQKLALILVSYRQDTPLLFKGFFIPSSLGGQLHCFSALTALWDRLLLHLLVHRTPLTTQFCVCNINCWTHDTHTPTQHTFNVKQLPICVGLAWALVLGNIPEIPYTTVFSSNCFKGIAFQIYWLCWHRYLREARYPGLRI